MRVFLNTNVWLSAVVFSGLCEELLLQCAERGWLCSSALVRRGAHEVLKRKFPQARAARGLFDAAWQEAQRIRDVGKPRADNDARLVAAAAAARMQLFVTGDKRVLGWDRVEIAPRIVAPRQVWNVLFGARAGH